MSVYDILCFNFTTYIAKAKVHYEKWIFFHLTHIYSFKMRSGLPRNKIIENINFNWMYGYSQGVIFYIVSISELFVIW